MKYTCGTCNSDTIVIMVDNGHWVVQCVNGHIYVPTQGTVITCRGGER